MLYRPFGKTGEKLSILGFGAMRMPVIDDDQGKIDEDQAIAMIRHAIDSGVNYLDTAWPYHNGMSEGVCAKAMKDGYREKVNIATKLPSWEIHCRADMDLFLDKQLKRLEVDQIDYYLLHTLNAGNWKVYQENDYKSFLKEAKTSGKIKYFGFSFHDNIDLFKEIVDDFEWDFVQIQLNYLDDNYQAGIEGMRYAAAKGMGVVIMEPLRGGMLSKTELPEDINKLWENTATKRTPTEWALRWVWDHPEVSIVLSGMSSIQHLKENITSAETALPLSLSKQEKETIESVKSIYLNRIRVNCTNCRYCLPCPQGVYIPELFWAYNHDSIFGDFGKAQFWATGFLSEKQRASNCIECGICESKCPQNIEIMHHLKEMVNLYEK